jgi:hypothetical protein
MKRIGIIAAALVAAIMAAPAMAGHHPYPICDKFDPHYPRLRHDNSRPGGTEFGGLVTVSILPRAGSVNGGAGEVLMPRLLRGRARRRASGRRAGLSDLGRPPGRTAKPANFAGLFKLNPYNSDSVVAALQPPGQFIVRPARILAQGVNDLPPESRNLGWHPLAMSRCPISV